MTTKELGDIGEKKALEFLRKKGFKIEKTNYRFHRNEVDIIYALPHKKVFVEVKTRQTSIFGNPWEAVTRGKQNQIIRCANHYLISNNLEEEAQFDIISIIMNQKGTFIEH